MQQMDIGKARSVREGEDVVILNFGTLLNQAIIAANELNIAVVDMRWVKPMDEALILAMAKQYALLVTLEENAVAGGAGSAVNELLAAASTQTATLNLGLPDSFVEHGTHADQLSWTGLNSDNITLQIRDAMQTHDITSAPTVNLHGRAEAPHR